MQQDNVSVQHEDYYDIWQKREIYLDVCEGTLKLREKRGQYLPQFPAETDADYDYRADTATCFNLTKKTRDVMTGLVFKDIVDLEADVNPQIRELWENIDNAGTHGDVFARKAFEHAFEGYSVILVDAPMATPVSREEQLRSGIRPYWILYTADNVWNWRTRVNEVSKKKELSLIVFREITTEAAGDFVSQEVVRFRVFRLDDNVVTWQLYREVMDNRTNNPSFEIEASGSLPQLTQIPVAVVGELGADPFLLDIALKNIEHFQTYSDYKSLIHKTCVPIPVGKGIELAGDDRIVVGGSTMVQTSAEGGFGFAEVTGNSLNVVRQTLQDNREEAALMGLSILTGQPQVMMTATETLLNSISETAELRVFARSLQDAIELCLGHTAEYLSLLREEGGSVNLRTAWSNTDSEFKVSLDEMNLRADIANKLTGIMSQEWLMKFLLVESEDEMNVILEQLRSQNVVMVETDDYLAQPEEPEPVAEETEEEEELPS
jgi:hypothetical protein